MCAAVRKQVSCICVYVHTAAFELQAESVNKDCSEMRHESSSALTLLLY